MPSQQSQSGSISAAQIEKYVGGIDFPCDKEELVDHARDKGAPQKILDLMDSFPDKEYGSPIDVARSIKEVKH